MTDDNSNSPIVELRSESDAPPTPLKTLGQKKNWKPWLITGGVIVVLLAIALIISFFSGGAALKDKDGRSTSKLPGAFGDLPFADDFGRDTSGLSGRSCDHPDRRAIGVMLAGDPINRPLSGFADADLVLELPVLASNVTRLTGFYQCGTPEEIGSVRSARHDYLFLAEGYDAILAHWGGSYHALNRIDVGEFQTINALTNPFNAFFRKDNLPRPYNGFTTYERLWNALQELGFRTTTEFEGYDFKEDPPVEERGVAGTLSIAWPGQFRVHWEYDPATNRYQRFWAGTKVVDGNTEAPVTPSTVIIMRATNGFAEGPGGYNEVGIEGEGEATVYQDGQVISATWRKNELVKKDPIHFTDASGNDITFTAGQVWIMTPSPDIDVTWEVADETSPNPEGAG